MNKISTIFMILFAVNIYAGNLEERLTDPQTQKEAIKELWDKGDAAVPELKLMVVSSNAELREIALVRIINLKSNVFVPEVTGILNSVGVGLAPTQQLKLSMQYLCVIKEKSVIPILEKMAVNNNISERERLYAIQAMSYIADFESEETMKILKELLKDKSGIIRMEAGYSLAEKFDDDAGYTIAVQDIKDTNPLIRERAVEVIGEIGKPESMPLIEAALQDEEIWVRTKAKIAKEKIELQSGVRSQESGAKPRKMSRKAMANAVGAGLAPAQKQKLSKLRAILNAEDKILDVKIWAANEMLNMDGGKEIADEIITKNEAGAYVMRKEMGNRR